MNRQERIDKTFAVAAAIYAGAGISEPGLFFPSERPVDSRIELAERSIRAAKTFLEVWQKTKVE